MHFGRRTPCWMVVMIMNLNEGVSNTRMVVVVAKTVVVTVRYTLLLGIKVGMLPINSISFYPPHTSCCSRSVQNAQQGHEDSPYSLPTLQHLEPIATSLNHVSCCQHHCRRPQRCDWYPITITNIIRHIRNNDTAKPIPHIPPLSSPLIRLHLMLMHIFLTAKAPVCLCCSGLWSDQCPRLGLAILTTTTPQMPDSSNRHSHICQFQVAYSPRHFA
jgi:hypothetical protein